MSSLNGRPRVAKLNRRALFAGMAIALAGTMLPIASAGADSAEVFVNVLDGDDNVSLGQIDNVADSVETNNGTELKVRLDLDEDVFGLSVVEAVVTASDGTDVVSSAVENIEAASSDDFRTFSIDVSSLQEGPLDIVATVDGNEYNGLTIYDVTAPNVTLTEPADEDAFLFLGADVPLCCSIYFFTKDVDFKGTVTDSVAGVRNVTIEASRASDGAEIRAFASLSNKDNSLKPRSADFSKTVELDPGEWTVRVCAEDLAPQASYYETNSSVKKTNGNRSCGPEFTIYMDGLVN